MKKFIKQSKKLPKITIAVINYNGKQYLRESIPPLLQLKYPDFEIIVIENNSNDGSVDYLKSIDQIKIIKNPVTGGKNHGLNLAIEKAQGKFILFLDNDALINDKNILGELVDFYHQLKDPGLISLTLINQGESKIYFYGMFLSYWSFIKKNRRLSRQQVKKLHGQKVAGVQGQAFFVRKDFINQIGDFDELIAFGGDDVNIGLRSIMEGKHNYLFAKDILIHIGMKERTDRTRHEKKFFLGNLGLFLTMITNYTWPNLLISLSLFIPYQLLKTIRDAWTHHNQKLIWEYIRIFGYLYNNRFEIRKKRQYVQMKRKIKTDIFFDIQILSTK